MGWINKFLFRSSDFDNFNLFFFFFHLCVVPHCMPAIKDRHNTSHSLENLKSGRDRQLKQVYKIGNFMGNHSRDD